MHVKHIPLISLAWHNKYLEGRNGILIVYCLNVCCCIEDAFPYLRTSPTFAQLLSLLLVEVSSITMGNK